MNFMRHAIVANKPRSCPIKPGSLRYGEHSVTNGTNLERYRWVTIGQLFPDGSSVRSVSVIKSTATSEEPRVPVDLFPKSSSMIDAYPKKTRCLSSYGESILDSALVGVIFLLIKHHRSYANYNRIHAAF